jgi:hypothetical protein
MKEAERQRGKDKCVEKNVHRRPMGRRTPPLPPPPCDECASSSFGVPREGTHSHSCLCSRVPSFQLYPSIRNIPIPPSFRILFPSLFFFSSAESFDSKPSFIDTSDLSFPPSSSPPPLLYAPRHSSQRHISRQTHQNKESIKHSFSRRHACSLHSCFPTFLIPLLCHSLRKLKNIQR